MAELLPLVVFSVAASGSPGPNNLLLWASGVRFGLRRTVPHLLGTALGVGATAAGVAAGIGVLIARVPALELGLKVAGSLYLVYLAWRIVGGRLSGGEEAAAPLGLWQAVVFQVVNVKVWIFALTAVAAFRPAELPVVLGSAVTVTTMMGVVLLTAVVWAAGGAAISRLVTSPRAQRVMAGVLALLLLLSVVQLWR